MNGKQTLENLVQCLQNQTQSRLRVAVSTDERIHLYKFVRLTCELPIIMKLYSLAFMAYIYRIDLCQICFYFVSKGQ